MEPLNHAVNSGIPTTRNSTLGATKPHVCLKSGNNSDREMTAEQNFVSEDYF